MLKLDTNDLAASLPELSATTSAEQREQELAAEMLAKVIDMIQPGIPAALRYMRRRGEDWVIGGPRVCHEQKAQYASTGRISGWAYILTANGLVFRRYSGTHSDFDGYGHEEHDDSCVGAAAVISGLLDAYRTKTASDHLTSAVEAIGATLRAAAAEKRSIAAEQRIAKISAVLEMLR